ncbi:MAG: transcriptional regulator CynR [bacterium]|nr:transcriptional regulator CynR [bacterium]
MELRQLRYLCAVARENHFTRAAETLFVTQSALSQQIQSLEQEVGVSLLDRSKRGVRLTAAGEVLVHHAQRVLHELELARVALDDLQGLQRGDLTIGVVQTVNAYMMPALVAAFAAKHPNIRLHIEELPADEIERRLEEGTLQLGISFMPAAHPQIGGEPLFAERLALIVPLNHPLAHYDTIGIAALHEMPMIMLTRTFCTRRLWEESARMAAAQPKVVLEMNTVSSILSAVSRTNLPAILPQLVLSEQDTLALRSIELRDPTPSRQVGLLWHKDYVLCSATRAFMTMTLEVAAGFNAAEVVESPSCASC